MCTTRADLELNRGKYTDVIRARDGGGERAEEFVRVVGVNDASLSVAFSRSFSRRSDFAAPREVAMRARSCGAVRIRAAIFLAPPTAK